MPKAVKQSTSPFMLFRANYMARVRAQEVLSDAPEEGFKTIWVRAKEKWVGMTSDETKVWEQKHEALKAEQAAANEKREAKKALKDANKAKRVALYAQYQDAVDKLHAEFMANLVAEGLAPASSLPADEAVASGAENN